jgi:hypothetical protein
MKVFFTASLSEREKYKEYYDTVVQTIQANGDEVISLEVQDYSYLIPKDVIESIPKNELHYTWLKKGIKKSNCVVIDASRDSFRLGHEASLAMLYNKPVLVISNKKDYSDVIINPRFYAHIYNSKADIQYAVTDFLKTVLNKHMGLRKNFIITSENRNFLKWYSNKFAMNDSEIVRQQLDELQKKHPEYEEADLEDLAINDENDEE